MVTASLLARDIAYALDPVLFAREALGFQPDPWQEQTLRWAGQRLLLNCCRQSGKSTVASVLGLHRALFVPSSLVLLVSPSLRQSGELFRKVSDLLGRLSVRPSMLEDNKLSLTLENGSRVVSLPGKEATVRGFSGASLIIEDEASRVHDDLYIAMRPMLAVSGGQHILMSTPFGMRGHFHAEWANGGDDWARVRIPATDCSRISPKFLAAERRSMGDLFFRSEYGCEFTDSIDQVFATDDIQAALSDQVLPLFGAVQMGQPATEVGALW